VLFVIRPVVLTKEVKIGFYAQVLRKVLENICYRTYVTHVTEMHGVIIYHAGRALLRTATLEQWLSKCGFLERVPKLNN